MKKLFALSACALALAACSNNGGTYYGKPQMNSKNTMQSGNGSPDQTPPPAAAVTSSSDKHITVGGDVAFSFPDSANWKKIQVNGVEVDLATVNLGNKLQVWQQSNTNIYSATGVPPKGLSYLVSLENGIYNDVVSGVLKPENGNARTAFFNGNLTNEQQIPNSGTVTYNVNTVVVPSEQGSASMLRTQLTADFQNKTLTGGLNGLNFDSVIKGNRFESKANAETTVKGGFFGENVAEIGGIFQNGNVVGAFGGKKQAQPQQ